MQRKKNEGIRQWQKDKSYEAEMKIMKIILDGEPHQYGELREKTKLSKATLSKHLKQMESDNRIIRHMDMESGKYPYPVYYEIKGKQSKLEKELSKFEQSAMERVEKAKNEFLKTQEPETFFKYMNYDLNYGVASITDFSHQMQQEGLVKNLNLKVKLFMDLLVAEFREYIWTFIQTVEPNIKRE
jgi:DNA-binding HxlR family transcriptional regulator